LFYITLKESERMKIRTIFLCVVIGLALLSLPVQASLSRDSINRMNYNLELVSSAINFYYQNNGEMPQSVNDLLEEGWIPGNMLNPFTGEAYDYQANNELGGEVIISNASRDYCGVTILGFRDTPHTLDMTSDDIHPWNGTAEDRLISSYIHRVEDAFRWYWADEQNIPQSTDDLKTAGYWPFDGTELNPYTGHSLSFNSDSVGDLKFRFDGEDVMCIAYYPDDETGAAVFDPEYFSQWTQF